MSFVDCYQGKSGFHTVYRSGGASISPFISQMFCDAIGLPVKRQNNEELGALGIVKMLMKTLGYVNDFEELKCDSYVDFMPDKKRHEAYQKLYGKFVSLQSSIEKHWV